MPRAPVRPARSGYLSTHAEADTRILGAPAAGVLGDVAGHPALAQFHDEVPASKPRSAASVIGLKDGSRSSIARARAAGFGGGAGELGIDHQAVPVLHQHVADKAELRLLPAAFAVQPGVGIGGRGVAIVGAPLAPAALARPPPLGCGRCSGRVRIVLGPELFIDAHASTRLRRR